MFEKEIIASLFKQVYESEFKSDNVDDRIRMQKAVYLMNAVGTPCGDYPFMWYLHGPYSYALDVVAQSITHDEISECSNCKFKPKTDQAVKRVKKLLEETSEGTYDKASYWPETLGSLHYLMAYEKPHESREKLIDYLMELKPHLDNRGMNEVAYDRIKELIGE